MFSGKDQIQFFEQILFQYFGKEVTVSSLEFISGGCINNAVRLNTAEGVFFMKWNVHDLEGMFEAEAKGLELLRNNRSIPTPKVYATGQKEEKAYILMEFISEGIPKSGFWEGFGRSLADLHRRQADYFGLNFNNFIGSLPQNNEPLDDGIAFFIKKRLKVQAGLAFYKGLINREMLDRFDLFYELLPDLIPSEKASLLHGDLWSGNFLVNEEGKACLIDPSVYYGFREAELAFTKLFGGFESGFYEAYQEAFPLEKDFENRIEIYNLYPLLVHLNLFGSAYWSAVERIIKKYVL